MTNFFSEKFMLIMFQNIPNRIVTCNDKDVPWITPEVKSAIKRNSRVYRKWVGFQMIRIMTDLYGRRLTDLLEKQKGLFQQPWFQTK